MSPELIKAHSLAEACLYLLVTPCPVCEHGAHRPSDFTISAGEGRTWIAATCGNCGCTERYAFDLPGPLKPVDPLSDAAPINATGEPSSIIDVAQWITLYHLMLEWSERTPDRQEARWRRYRAGQCLEEALRFYAPDNDLPVESAFFSARSRQVFRDHPQRFARERLLGLRARLPASREDAVPVPKGQRPRRSLRWWRFWSS